MNLLCESVKNFTWVMVYKFYWFMRFVLRGLHDHDLWSQSESSVPDQVYSLSQRKCLIYPAEISDGIQRIKWNDQKNTQLALLDCIHLYFEIKWLQDRIERVKTRRESMVSSERQLYLTWFLFLFSSILSFFFSFFLFIFLSLSHSQNR